MLITGLTTLALACAAVIGGSAYALLELALRNYRTAAVAALIATAAVPFVLIGRSLTLIATALVANP